MRLPDVISKATRLRPELYGRNAAKKSVSRTDGPAEVGGEMEGQWGFPLLDRPERDGIFAVEATPMQEAAALGVPAPTQIGGLSPMARTKTPYLLQHTAPAEAPARPGSRHWRVQRRERL